MAPTTISATVLLQPQPVITYNIEEMWAHKVVSMSVIQLTVQICNQNQNEQDQFSLRDRMRPTVRGIAAIPWPCLEGYTLSCPGWYPHVLSRVVVPCSVQGVAPVLSGGQGCIPDLSLGVTSCPVQGYPLSCSVGVPVLSGVPLSPVFGDYPDRTRDRTRGYHSPPTHMTRAYLPVDRQGTGVKRLPSHLLRCGR